MDGSVRQHAREHSCPQRNDGRDILPRKSLAEQPYASVAVVRPGFIIANGTNPGEEIDVAPLEKLQMSQKIEMAFAARSSAYMRRSVSP